MEYVSSVLLWTSPFALFCSEDGNGLTIGAILATIGLVCRWIGNNVGVKRLPPREFWEAHYHRRLTDNLTSMGKDNEWNMAEADQEARKYATTMCRYSGISAPSDSAQEQFAIANGIITKRMLEEQKEEKYRIQIGKYFLMNKLIEKYANMKIDKGGLVEKHNNKSMPSALCKGLKRKRADRFISA